MALCVQSYDGYGMDRCVRETLRAVIVFSIRYQTFKKKLSEEQRVGYGRLQTARKVATFSIF